MPAPTTAAAWAAAAAGGALAWTLVEYVLHRWDMHGRSRGAIRREHREHHATARPPARTAGTWSGATLVAVGLGAGVHPALGVGWLAAYVAYEAQHHAVHARAPRTRRQRWQRRHHLAHHHGHPGRNYGVTSPLWDAVLGTRAPPGRVVVPRRLAPPWLLGPDGAVHPTHAGDYELSA